MNDPFVIVLRKNGKDYFSFLVPPNMTNLEMERQFDNLLCKLDELEASQK